MDNRYFTSSCPAKMSDGRFITTYSQGRDIDQRIRLMNKITSSHEYRQFLQKNGDTLIDRERLYTLSKFSCNTQDNKCYPLSFNQLPESKPWANEVYQAEVETQVVEKKAEEKKVEEGFCGCAHK
jgi:hypothetical protein